MNAVPENFIVNSCQYTPVYLIQDPGASQGQSFYITHSNIEEPKPVSDNLKSFYESSGGNIENGVVSHKPRIIKKSENIVGNNLKLASFLIPKNDNVNKQQYVVNNGVLKSNVTVNNISSNVSTVNTVPRLNIDSKIVKLKNVELKTKYNRVERTTPKMKPKEVTHTVLTAAPTKHTSVQLLKLGETYHSLNQLSDEQMKMVTQALKIFSNPEKIAPEPTYDPITNTKFIYKVVSPRDLTVVGKNKVASNKAYELKTDNIYDIKEYSAKEMARKELFLKEVPKKEVLAKTELGKKDIYRNDIRKEMIKVEIKKDIRKEEKVKTKVQKEVLEEDIVPAEPVEAKVTRSGRKVKLPKPMLSVGNPHKPKKKNTLISCFQCSAEFSSLYRLQKHYESHPTHIPAKIHSNLFHCLLAIIKSGTAEDRANIFIQQLEQLIVKLRSLLPCLMKNKGEGKQCTINKDVGSLLGMEPGKYNFDIDALNCVRNKDGFCHHNQPPKDLEKSPQAWISINNEDILSKSEIETEDCARINSVEKWPTVNKRVWKQKQQKENAKKMRLTSENGDAIIELDDIVVSSCTKCSDNSAISSPIGEVKADSIENNVCNEFKSNKMSLQQPEIQLPSETIDLPIEPSFLEADPTLLSTEADLQPVLDIVPPNGHTQFHSTHFDIRSSPIKPSSTVFRKFQINPELLAKYEEQNIRSIETVNKEQVKEIPPHLEDSRDPLNPEDTLQEIFKDEDLSAVKESFTLDKELKDWILNRSNDEKSDDGFGKTDTLIEPALLHVKDSEILNDKPIEIQQKDVLPDNHDESSVLNFLDCLSYPGTEIRTNNGDFQMDLFSFSSS